MSGLTGKSTWVFPSGTSSQASQMCKRRPVSSAPHCKGVTLWLTDQVFDCQDKWIQMNLGTQRRDCKTSHLDTKWVTTPFSVSVCSGGGSVGGKVGWHSGVCVRPCAYLRCAGWRWSSCPCRDPLSLSVVVFTFTSGNNNNYKNKVFATCLFCICVLRWRCRCVVWNMSSWLWIVNVSNWETLGTLTWVDVCASVSFLRASPLTHSIFPMVNTRKWIVPNWPKSAFSVAALASAYLGCSGIIGNTRSCQLSSSHGKVVHFWIYARTPLS